MTPRLRRTHANTDEQVRIQGLVDCSLSASTPMGAIWPCQIHVYKQKSSSHSESTKGILRQTRSFLFRIQPQICLLNPPLGRS